MKELFPAKQIMGFVFSLILTVIALAVYFFDMSMEAGTSILLITAFIQASLQFIVFMHAGETEDKKTIYTSTFYGVLIAIATVFGSLLALTWGYM